MRLYPTAMLVLLLFDVMDGIGWKSSFSIRTSEDYYSVIVLMRNVSKASTVVCVCDNIVNSHL